MFLNQDTKSLSSLLKNIYDILRNYSHISNPYLESLILLSHNFNLTKEEIISNQNIVISKSNIEILNSYLQERIKEKPISKIIKKKRIF